MGRKRVYENNTARYAANHRRTRIPRETYLSSVKKEKTDRKLEAWRNKPFIAIDGEGEDDNTGTHHYTMLTASDGTTHSTIEGKSLSTIECFIFLLKLKKDNPSGIFIGFSINYDINMMLKDVSLEALTQLWKGGYCLWEQYMISWIPSKMIRISYYQNGYQKKKKATASITIYDAFGFFQTSFLRTLERWDIGTVEQRHLIYAMKKQRGYFADTLNSEILDYNTLECDLLVKLMQKLRQALDTCGLYLQSWHGAGAVGGQFLKINGIEKHIADVPEHIQDAIMHAYFGGRFQTLMLGEHKNAHSHDIRSAYPAAFLELPPMHGEWKEVNEYDAEKIYAIYYVKWSINRDAKNISPFPHRYKRRISYPTAAEGWYWYPEVSAAIGHYGTQVQVIRGFVFAPDNTSNPFSFLNNAYAQRNAFKAAKNDAQMVLKLGINSVYGKTAQGTIGNKKPKFQSYFWAGYCTSITRARIFEMAMRNPESVIAFAADGIFAREKLTIESEDENTLGNWEHNGNFYLFWAQSGVYFTYDYEKQKNMHAHVGRKTRGLGKNEIRFGQLRKQWRNRKTRHAAGDTVHIRRFFGLQYCLHTNRMDLWRKWSTVTKTLELWPRGNHIAIEEKKDYIRFGQAGMNGVKSEPYIEKGVKKETDNEELLEYYLDISQPEFED